MIPKVIHYCWLSNDPYPDKIRKCMDTWKKVLPDYQIKLWNTENFDMSKAPAYVREAFEQRKWAFASDYIRMYALYTEGGVYLDSDVKILKSFDEFLNYKFFTSLEYHSKQIEMTGAMDMIDDRGNRIKEGFVSGIQIQAAVMGSEAGCQFVKDVLDDYEKREFIYPEGSNGTGVISPFVYARVMEKYGFKYLDKDQALEDNMMVFRSEIFAGNKYEATPASYAIHYCAHSWKRTPMEKLSRWLKRNIPCLFPKK